GIDGMHLYIPWWLYGDKKKDFPRGYHIELGGGFPLPQLGTFAGECARHEGYGKALKAKIREEYDAYVHFAGLGEIIPTKNSWCESDPSKTDGWGIPVLRFHFGWSQNEYNQIRHMQETFASIIETMGGQVIGERRSPDRAISTGGAIIHEAGTTRMGKDP